jgi:hypothetical protein
MISFELFFSITATYILAVYFSLEILSGFTTAYFSEGIVIADRAHIAKHYLRNGFA